VSIQACVFRIFKKGTTTKQVLYLSGCTPLHIAAHHGNINIANYLLSLGAKVNAKTKVSFGFQIKY